MRDVERDGSGGTPRSKHGESKGGRPERGGSTGGRAKGGGSTGGRAKGGGSTGGRAKRGARNGGWSGRGRAKRGRLKVEFDLEALMCLVLAVALSGIGVFSLRDLYYLERRGEVVSATVLSESSGRPPHITVRYVTRAGQTIEDDTSNYDQAKVGGTIDVIYDREDPYRMQAANFGTSPWIPGVILFGLALLALLFGIAGLWPQWVS